LQYELLDIPKRNRKGNHYEPDIILQTQPHLVSVVDGPCLQLVWVDREITVNDVVLHTIVFERESQVRVVAVKFHGVALPVDEPRQVASAVERRIEKIRKELANVFLPQPATS
jgi:hypothetical protein